MGRHQQNRLQHAQSTLYNLQGGKKVTTVHLDRIVTVNGITFAMVEGLIQPKKAKAKGRPKMKRKYTKSGKYSKKNVEATPTEG